MNSKLTEDEINILLDLKERHAKYQKNYYYKKKENDPEYLKKKAETVLKWRETHREEYNAKQRAWRQRKKEAEKKKKEEDAAAKINETTEITETIAKDLNIVDK